MNEIDVREQNLCFQMESVNQSDLQNNDQVDGESETPATKGAAYKLPHGTLKETQSSTQHKNAHCQWLPVVTKRLVFCLKTAAVIVFLVAVAALVLAVITMVSRNNQSSSKDCADAADNSVSVKNLLRRIQDLENKMLAMEAKMAEVLKAQVNETANEEQVNNSVKELNKNDQEITSTVNELRQNQILTKSMSERLAINVTELETRVQELSKSNSNISSRATREKGYSEMNNLMKALQAVDGVQNASLQDVQSMHNRLEESLTAVNATMNEKIATVDGVWVNLTNTHDAFEKKLDTEFKQLNNSVQSMHNRLQESLTAVNATMNEKLNALGSNSSKPAAKFSMCYHTVTKGTPATANYNAGLSTASYTEPKNRRAMGITCSTDYAAHYKLTEVSEGEFVCSCRAVSQTFSANIKKIVCHIHVWECPI